MNETLISKLTRLLSDEHIYKVEINIKCKTRDGMIYTILSTEHSREGMSEEEKAACISFPEAVDTSTTKELLDITRIIEKGDGFWFSVEEMVSVRNSEIVRIWAELGDLYYDDTASLIGK